MRENKDILDTEQWKLAPSYSKLTWCISVPYLYQNKIEDGWIIGPLTKETAEWLHDAIKIKQDIIKGAKLLVNMEKI